MSDPKHGRGCPCERCTNRRTRNRLADARRREARRHQPKPILRTTIPPTAPIRTYGEPWDSIINAGASCSVPPSGLPRNNDTMLRRRT